MSCEPKFDTSLPFSCVVSFINEARQGVTPQLIKKGMWIAGCLMEKFLPSDAVTISAVPVHYETLKEALDALEARMVVMMAEDATAARLDWAALIPIILEIIRLITTK